MRNFALLESHNCANEWTRELRLILRLIQTISFSAVPCYSQSHDILSIMLILIYFFDDIAHLEEYLIPFTLLLEPQISAVLFAIQEQPIFKVFFIFWKHYQAILIKCNAWMLLLYLFALLLVLCCQENHIREDKNCDRCLNKEGFVGGNISSCIDVNYMSEFWIKVNQYLILFLVLELVVVLLIYFPVNLNSFLQRFVIRMSFV